MINNISFELRRGECLGLIGPNGSGKSTLLKILNGIITPDKGRIEIMGRVGALIEIGAGFHPMLTGRENIYVNGSILGFSKKEIDDRFDEIVEFAELSEFIDTPVKHYSSGMHVRLGFAIAAQMEPDIFLIDEVLAVGDMGFKMKCMNVMSKLLNNAAVVFVSHSMLHIAQICTKIIVLEQGKLGFRTDDFGAGIDYYVSRFNIPEGKISRYGGADIKDIRISNEKTEVSGNTILNAEFGDDLIVAMRIQIESSARKVGINIVLKDREFRSVAQCSSVHCGFVISGDSNEKIVKVRIPQLRLNSGIYSLIITVGNIETKEIMLRYDYAAYIQFPVTYASGSTFLLDGDWGQDDIQ